MHRFEDGTCEIGEHDDCDEERDGHTCNPPEPSAYPCPDGVGDAQIVQVGADCWIHQQHVACPDDGEEESESTEPSAPAHPSWLDAPGY